MKNYLKDYFQYTKSERNGFITLTVLCVLVPLVFFGYEYFNPSEIVPITIEELPPANNIPSAYDNIVVIPFDFNPNQASVDDFIKLGLSPKIAKRILKYREKGGSFRKKEDFKKVYGISDADYKRLEPYIQLPYQKGYQRPNDIPTSYSNVPKKEIELFLFDPNTATKEELQRLGLSNRVVSTILNFRAKGHFRKPDDFKKIFGLTETNFLRLKPYINIVKEAKTEQSSKPVFKKDTTSTIVYTKEKIDINIAAREEWELISGIGKVLSKRIVDYREALGGFHSIEQIRTVYGLEDSVFQKITPQLVLSPFEIKKLNINTATRKELSKHPLLNSRQAQIIVNYRENHGNYKSTDDLKNIRAFDADFLRELAFYVKVE